LERSLPPKPPLRRVGGVLGGSVGARLSAALLVLKFFLYVWNIKKSLFATNFFVMNPITIIS